MLNRKLFLDWRHINPGTMQASYDPIKLTDKRREIMELIQKEFNIKYDMTGNGVKRTHMPFGVKISIEKAKRTDPWLVEDKTWENAIGWPTVINEDGKYRCWYGGSFGMAYAESEDGFNWCKPNIGLHLYNGSKDNNIVWPDVTLESAVFLDDSAPIEERYKCFLLKVLQRTGPSGRVLFGGLSADGFNWTKSTEPVIRQRCDTQNVAYWDYEKKKYVGYFRGASPGRAIDYGETDDFYKWPKLDTILFPESAMEDPSNDYYSNCFTLYPDDPSIKLIFCAIYHMNSDIVDVRMATTVNGKSFSWVSYEPIVDVGNPGEWDCGSVYTSPNMVYLPNGMLALPCRSSSTTHNEGTGYYKEEYQVKEKGGISWATWDDGRLAGIEAEDYGEFWTREPEVFDGENIEINARTKGLGTIEVEILEAEPTATNVLTPVKGFTFNECVPFRGDEIWTPLKYKGKNDLSSLKGKHISLRVRMSSAKIFGYRITNN